MTSKIELDRAVDVTNCNRDVGQSRFDHYKRTTGGALYRWHQNTIRGWSSRAIKGDLASVTAGVARVARQHTQDSSTKRCNPLESGATR